MAEKDNQEPKIRGVKRIDAPIEPDEENSSSETQENFVQQAFHTVQDKVSGGWKRAKTSWFGLKPAGNAISNTVGKTADFLNVSKKGLSVVLGVVLGLSGVVGTATLISNRQMNVIIRQEDIDECGDLLAQREGAQIEETDVEDWKAAQMEVAKKIWAVCKAFGMTDEQAAGVLGNMQQEGGVDPTSLEGTYSERQHIGPIKAAALPKGSTGKYTMIPQGSTYMSYKSLGSGPDQWYDPATKSGLFAYMQSKGGSGDYSGPGTCGLGLIQWSFGRGINLLIFADCNPPHNWYDLDLQLAFLFGYDEPGTIAKYIAMHHTSVAEAARSWHQLVERNGSAFVEGGSQPRIEKAEKWYAVFSPQSALIQTQYASFVDSVMQMANASGTVAAGASAKENKCGEAEDEKKADNSDLAHAAVAYAWETVDMGVGNNGTDLYIAVHDAMFPGDGLYMSCDRGVATAVHWSGADDNFPKGGAGTCGRYMRSHPDKWQEVFDVSNGFRGEWDQLQAGDIFVVFGDEMQARTGLPRDNFSDHIAMYVSVEIVREKYPDSNCEFVSASYQHRSPGCQDGGSGRLGASTRLKSYWEGRSTFNNSTPYHVFRYIGNYDGEDKKKYTGSASGV